MLTSPAMESTQLAWSSGSLIDSARLGSLLAARSTFKLNGPGVLVGDNPFSLTESGGAGAIWIKTRPESVGRIVVEATHATLGAKQMTIEVRAGNFTRRI